LYNVPDDELDPIGRMVIHEPQKWISTQAKLDNYRHEKIIKEYRECLSENEPKDLEKTGLSYWDRDYWVSPEERSNKEEKK
jgi:ATP-dependent protease ClpP protease subunit